MKPKRVKCDKCQHFIDITFKDEGNLISNIDTTAKCKLGKRVIFRMPKISHSCYPLDNGGYIRYCNDFKEPDFAN